MTPSTAAELASGEGRVLIVDDDKHNRRLLKMMLTGAGYDTEEATDGAQAVERVRSDPPDLILMDVMMPGMNGFEATAAIKRECGERFIPVIFLTALDDEDSLLRGIEAGGDDFLNKPLNLSVLRAKIHAMERLRDLHHGLRERNEALDRARARQAWEEETAESVFSRAITGRNVADERLRVHQWSAATFSGDVVLSDFTPDGGLRVLVGDFTGHGLAAAIGTYPVSETFHTLTREGVGDTELVFELNQVLHGFLPPSMFMGALLVTFEPDGQAATIWNGGLPEALLCSSDGSLRSLASQAMPLGILPRMELDSLPVRYPVRENDTLLIVTDGILEAEDASGEAFGEDRLRTQLCYGDPAPGPVDRLAAALSAHLGTGEPADDMTAVAIRCSPEVVLEGGQTSPPDTTGTRRWSLEVAGAELARVDLADEARQQLRHWFPQPNEHIQAMQTVIAELCNNAFEHGVLGLSSEMKATAEGFAEYYRLRQQGLEELDGRIGISLRYRRTDNWHCVRIRVRDSGAGFDHERVRRALEGESDERLWGRGLTLVHRLCRHMRHLGSGNVVEAEYAWMEQTRKEQQP
ncbi:fused response regulator/phosphatase [Thioalkalivibrio sp. ALJ24]|uniref:ATP-binding SpoIIE family protein phosphatase n=1 Tax=Thioalkalivibrio sp. ALJ24 TaxID=545276 RepID=UPI00037DCA4E|nr:fused response regulator/phosphatase [Thioalkalivibrio sp. ALJ24]